MKKIVFLSTFILVALITSALFYTLEIPLFSKKPAPISPPVSARYLDPTLPTEERIANLLSQMTLEEKIGQMALVDKGSVHDIHDVALYGIGAILSGAGAKPKENTREGWVSMVSEFTTSSKKSRLGIPILYGADAFHGNANVPGATVFPHAISLGATRDAKLVEEVARASAEELTATDIMWSFSPNLDLPQDIRWGRVYETFTDDPVLASELGNAYIRGLQKRADGEDESIFVLSTPKHYLGAGGMLWKSSRNKSFHIDQGTTPGREDVLRQTYLPPFTAAVEQGALSIMVGQNTWADADVSTEDYTIEDFLKAEWGLKGTLVSKINAKVRRIKIAMKDVDGIKLPASKYLLTEVLKEELGFKGFAVSDWYDVYEIPGGDYVSAVTAINAGIDMVMLPFDYKTFIKNVTKAVERGDITQERIDDAVSRILRAKFAVGLFDDVKKERSAELGSVEHRALARKAVASSLVLLKNEESVLPIAPSTKHIRVAGSVADNFGRQAGAWTVEWQGIDGNWIPGATTILEGIRKRAGSETIVEYELGGNFKDTTKIADIGIAVVGEKPYAEGWGDRAIPALDDTDLATIKNLQASSKKVIVVLISGRPLFITGEIPTWDASVVAWLPGSEGAGVADVLFGDKPFTGKLPLPWPAYTQQLPISPDGKTADGTEVLFPRYFGLE